MDRHRCMTRAPPDRGLEIGRCPDTCAARHRVAATLPALSDGRARQKEPRFHRTRSRSGCGDTRDLTRVEHGTVCTAQDLADAAIGNDTTNV